MDEFVPERGGVALGAADYLYSLQPAKEPDAPEAVLRAMEGGGEPIARCSGSGLLHRSHEM